MRLITSLLLLSAAILVAPAASGQQVRFNSGIRAILAENCFACHGPDKNKRQANLRLDERASAIARSAIVPRSPAKSLLIRRVNSPDPALVMPPVSSKKLLTSAQKAALAAWIRQGAEYQPHWSYIPPKRPPVVIIQKPKSKIQNPIDAFVQRELQRKGIRPSQEADRRTLIRRVFLDVVGLPPSIKDAADFVADRSPNAYEKVVDRLLASPRYGERMASPWLDIVRYADTVGYHGDQNHNAWAYRDYVIKSFNDNKPFDQFTREQIAGDMLPNPTPDQLTATCFNRLNMTTREGGAQPKEYLSKYAGDRVRTVSMTWLGSTVGCAECHDHKYDPFTQRDFYSLSAFFADVKQWGVYQDYDYTPNPDLKGWSNDHPFPPEIKVESKYLRERIADLRARIRKLASETASKGMPTEFEEWRKSAVELFARNPDGWRGPGGIEVTAVDGKQAVGRTLGALQPDGTVLVNGAAPPEVGLLLKPGDGWLAALKLDLLPHAQNDGSILRKGSGTTLRMSIELRREDGKVQPVAVRHASAAYHDPAYYNGFDILGIQGGWRLPRNHLQEQNTSLWTLTTPIRLSAGDRLLLKFTGARVGHLRVGCSPFGPDDPNALSLSSELASAVRDPSSPDRRAVIQEAYLRSTGWHSEAFAKLKAIEAGIVECRNGVTPVMVVQQMPPMTVRVLPRGNWQDESGPVVEPATPGFLPRGSLPVGRRLNRLDLANWLISPENPLTARMFVNRLWKQFFGSALSDKVEDLGTQGETPTHPELLDWLAAEFMRPGGTTSRKGASPWDIKQIVRLIVTSTTYRQSSRPRKDLANIDPANRLLASQNARRLDAEFVRDNALAISGLINLDMGGPPCKPYQPALYYANLQFPDREYQPDRDDRQWRRGVYAHWQRTFLHPMLAAFDAPSREECSAARTAANTPQQAMTLLNDPEFVEAARAFATRLMAVPGDDAARLGQAYEIALARPIKPTERHSLLAALAKLRQEYRALPEDAAKLLRTGSAPVQSGDEVELAAWASVCRIILNLHETITRY